MRREFNDVYTFLFNEYYQGSRRTILLIEFDDFEARYIYSIGRQIRGNGNANRLRPDARYFLLVNFHQMILKPVLASKPLYQISPSENEELMEAVRKDIDTIINSSVEISESSVGDNPNEDGISGHQIMRTIDRLWGQLRTTKFEIWG